MCLTVGGLSAYAYFLKNGGNVTIDILSLFITFIQHPLEYIGHLHYPLTHISMLPVMYQIEFTAYACRKSIS